MSITEQLSDETVAMTSPHILVELGEQIIIDRVTTVVITDVCDYHSWSVYYGICHAMYMTARSRTKAAYWKELRSHFLYKTHKIENVMYGSMEGHPAASE